MSNLPTAEEVRGLVERLNDDSWLDGATVSETLTRFNNERIQAAQALTALLEENGGLRVSQDHAPTSGSALEWRSMDSAPTDGRPILGWCVHDADPYWLESGNLTLYGGHAEGMSHVEDGPHVLVWGGSWDDRTHEYDGGWMPDWWFLRGSEFEVAANPVAWMPITAPIDSRSQAGTADPQGVVPGDNQNV